MCEKSWDVIVVGGGPAGLAAAITARQKAFSTLLIDHRELPTAGHLEKPRLLVRNLIQSAH